MIHNAIALDFMSYNDIIAKLGHTSVEILKMDIEGFEFQVRCVLPAGWRARRAAAGCPTAWSELAFA